MTKEKVCEWVHNNIGESRGSCFVKGDYITISYFTLKIFKFCPNCGRKMKLVKS
jgi:hypothetical protein